MHMPHSAALLQAAGGNVNKSQNCLLSYIWLFFIIYQQLLLTRSCHFMGRQRELLVKLLFIHGISLPGRSAGRGGEGAILSDIWDRIFSPGPRGLSQMGGLKSFILLRGNNKVFSTGWNGGSSFPSGQKFTHPCPTRRSLPVDSPTNFYFPRQRFIPH